MLIEPGTLATNESSNVGRSWSPTDGGWITDRAHLVLTATGFAAVASQLYPAVRFISGDLPDGYRLTRPIRVEVEVEGSEYVASQDDLLLHAFGATTREAIANLRHDIVDLKQDLEAEARLAPRLEHHRALLRQWVSRKDA